MVNLPTDIDECSASIRVCNINADCHNTLGSYSCSCKPGFTGNGMTCAKRGKLSLKPISNPVVFIFILSNLKALRIQIGSWCDDLESQCNPLYFRFILRLLAGCFIYFQISKRTAATKWCYYLQCSVFLSFLGTERQICLLDNISKKLNKYLGEKEKKTGIIWIKCQPIYLILACSWTVIGKSKTFPITFDNPSCTSLTF